LNENCSLFGVTALTLLLCNGLGKFKRPTRLCDAQFENHGLR